MARNDSVDLVRRRVMQAMLAIPALTITACGGSEGEASQSLPTSPSALNPTPACDDGDDDPTPAQTDGIYSAELLLNVQDAAGGKTGAFNFVLV